VFTVKAEVHQDVGPNHFHLFEANSVRVHRARKDGNNADGTYIAPELEIELYDDGGKPFKWLDVGQGLDHYSAVFVMNGRGKTVETIYPGNHIRPINVG
jgi:hypothetical protein